MSNSLAVFALVGGISGIVAAGTTALFVSPAADSTQEAAMSADEAAQLLSAMESLSEKNDALLRRVESLESAAPIQAPILRREVEQPKTDEEVALESEVRAFLDNFKDPANTAPVQIQETVADALRNIREEEEREREERRAMARAERMDQRLADLSVELSLSPGQTGDLKVLFTDTDSKRDALISEARENGEWGSLRDTVRTLYDEQNQRVSQILTPTQYEQYQDSDNRVSSWGFGRGGGGRGNDAGGRGGNNGGGGRNRSGRF